jgi:5-methylcytosine-specific restriction endonuclease McrA
MLFPKPKKCDRLGIIRRKQIAADWPHLRDERKRELQLPDGSWTCFYCNNPIWTWEETVIAHIEPKGREPAKKLDKSNLVPSHMDCNLTSSKHYRTERNGSKST